MLAVYLPVSVYLALIWIDLNLTFTLHLPYIYMKNIETLLS